MIEEALVKSNFVGRDGFRWWIGQVGPEKCHQTQINGGGWGYRYKVRIMGYHPQSENELPSDDLPWAQVLLPPDAGSGAQNRGRSVRIAPGDTVMGFFLDGDNAQLPVIQGVLGRTLSCSAEGYTVPFKPFTGYTDKVKNDGAHVIKLETNEANPLAMKKPKFVPQDIVSKLNDAASSLGSPEAQSAISQATGALTSTINEATNQLDKATGDIPPEVKKIIQNPERTFSKALGKVIPLATSSGSSEVNKISAAVNNLVKDVTSITDKVDSALDSVDQKLSGLVETATTKISGLSTGIVNNMVGDIYSTMAPIANKGLIMLGNGVYSKVFAATKSGRIATMAKKAAQNTFANPISAMQDALPCLAKNIIGTMGDAVKGLLKGLIQHVKNFVGCIADQFMGGLMNQIIGGITKGLSGLLGPLGKIMGGFNLINSLRSGAEGLLGMALAAASCGPSGENPLDNVLEWVVGKGPKNLVGVSVQAIMGAANTANGLIQDLASAGQSLSIATGSLGPFDFLNPNVSVPGFSSGFGECFAGTPFACGAPTVKIFGGGGTGAIAKAILGNVVENIGGSRTSSVLGVDITAGGSGYTVPPFVEITDSCNQGYGGIARAVIDYNENSPTYQQVVDIYIVSEGENYPLGDQADTTLDPYVIDDIIVVDPGTDYDKDDKVRDGLGQEYDINVDDRGQILSVRPINSATTNVQEVKNLQDILFTIESDAGRGAILRSRLKPRPEYQGEIKEVIDCVT